MDSSKNNKNSIRAEKLQNHFLLSLVVVSTVMMIILFSPFITALLLAGTFAIIFSPMHAKVVNLLKGRRGIASVISIFIVFLFIFVPLLFFGTLIFQEASELIRTLANNEDLGPFDDMITSAEERVQAIFPAFTFDVGEIAGRLLNWFVQNFGVVFTGIAQVFFLLFLGFFSLYYFFKDGHKFKKRFIELSPLKDKYDNQIINKLKNTVKSVIGGVLTIALIQGISTAIGFLVFGVPNPALWGGVAFILSLIPTIGPTLIIVPAVVYLFLVDNIVFAIGLAIWGVVAVSLVDNLLGPKLIQRRASLHPFLILLSVLGGLSFFGIVGFIMGPLILSFFLSVLEVYASEFKYTKEEPSIT